MAKITAPVKGFEGKVVGVQFSDGKAETDNEGALGYFLRHGYKVEGAHAPKKASPVYPEGLPTGSWKNDQLAAFAKDNDVDLAGASKKDEMLAILLDQVDEADAAEGGSIDDEGDNEDAADEADEADVI